MKAIYVIICSLHVFLIPTMVTSSFAQSTDNDTAGTQNNTAEGGLSSESVDIANTNSSSMILNNTAGTQNNTAEGGLSSESVLQSK